MFVFFWWLSLKLSIEVVSLIFLRAFSICFELGTLLSTGWLSICSLLTFCFSSFFVLSSLDFTICLTYSVTLYLNKFSIHSWSVAVVSKNKALIDLAYSSPISFEITCFSYKSLLLEIKVIYMKNK